MGTAGWIQTVLMVVLVGVTAYYAWRTGQMSHNAERSAEATLEQVRATREQAEASRAMVKVSQAQMIHSVKPELMPTKGPGSQRPWPPDSGRSVFVSAFTMWYTNQGRGAALNPEFSVDHPHLTFFPTRRGPANIASGEGYECTFNLEQSNLSLAGTGSIDPALKVVAVYHDVLGNMWHSTMECHWDENSRGLVGGKVQFALRRAAMLEEAV